MGSEVAKIMKMVGVPKICSMVTDYSFLFARSLVIMIIVLLRLDKRLRFFLVVA